MKVPLSLKIIKYCPQHMISRLVGWLANCRCKWVKNILIRLFIKHFRVDMQAAEHVNAEDYATFNHFFTRRLKSHLRSIVADASAIVSPVDGVLSEYGQIKADRITQAKGHDYSLLALLGGDESLANKFMSGQFITAYLAPRDYHRFHMPFSGQLQQMVYVPGRLFPVNPPAVATIDGLFARNERVICEFITDLGAMLVIAVGATNVGNIVIHGHGQVTPNSSRTIYRWDMQQRNISIARGHELGYFCMGSTIIVLFPAQTLQWQEGLCVGATLQMGQKIAKTHYSL